MTKLGQRTVETHGRASPYFDVNPSERRTAVRLYNPASPVMFYAAPILSCIQIK